MMGRSRKEGKEGNGNEGKATGREEGRKEQGKGNKGKEREEKGKGWRKESVLPRKEKRKAKE